MPANLPEELRAIARKYGTAPVDPPADDVRMIDCTQRIESALLAAIPVIARECAKVLETRANELLEEMNQQPCGDYCQKNEYSEADMDTYRINGLFAACNSILTRWNLDKEGK